VDQLIAGAWNEATQLALGFAAPELTYDAYAQLSLSRRQCLLEKAECMQCVSGMANSMRDSNADSLRRAHALR